MFSIITNRTIERNSLKCYSHVEIYLVKKLYGNFVDLNLKLGIRKRCVRKLIEDKSKISKNNS